MDTCNILGHILADLPECLNEDVIQVESITDRVDELRSDTDDLRTTLAEAKQADEEAGLDCFTPSPEHVAAAAALEEWIPTGFSELKALEALLDDLRGNGGDHQWEGDWYPATLYRDDETFTDHIEELTTDCYALNLPPFVEVDWKATADNCRVDYTEIEIDGVTYLYR